MIRILKASAGSGKTYNLAREYIRLLLVKQDPQPYRHILAVTFTNKATDEMKGRILQELHVLATDPASSPYYGDFVPAVCPDAESLRQRAALQLSGILHDYSAFAVSTIDRFFQQTLRAFSREIGQFSSYQVELDKASLVDESVERILDSLTEEDRDLLDWLTESAKTDMEKGKRFNLEPPLKEIAANLRSEDHEAAVRRYGIDEDQACTKERLRGIRASCVAVEKQFARDVSLAAQAVLDVLALHGVDPADSNRGFLKTLYAYSDADGRTQIEKPSAAFLEKAPDSSKWFAKSKDSLRLRLEGELETVLDAFCALFGDRYKVYRTARVVMGQIYGLGLAGELRKAFADLQKEKNVISIDDSNTILKDIIDGSDAPFVYEKLGVRFEDFLLDEFQDTSQVQWENFRPLLRNSVASGFDNLVVGDVKQSIYRWRGSDWQLLESGLQREFSLSSDAPEVLDGNYRTCRTIVEFNNSFFPFAAGKLDALLGGDEVRRIYRDVEQQVCFRDPAEGSVDVQFCDDSDAEMAAILETVASVRAAGGGLGDIAILVRGNAEGAEIAARLIANGIPVVSDDSLFVKSSVTVRRLVSQLSLADNPSAGDSTAVAGYLARSMGVVIPDHYHSLLELAESLLRDLKEADGKTFDAEIPYVQSFMDYLLDWTVSHGNDLSGFLRDWEDASPKIASPDSESSVRVMTVHKSKGLEFPYVIFPFAEKMTLYKSSARWCRPSAEAPALPDLIGGVYRVDLSDSTQDTLFAADYRRERVLQYIDNLNVLYVALTRPKYGLKIIAKTPSRKVRDAVAAGQDAEWKDLSQILYGFVGGSEYHRGTRYDFNSLARRKAVAETIETGWPSFPAGNRGRLRFSRDAADFFGPDGLVGPQASNRLRGLVLHEILSAVRLTAELSHAVDGAVASGALSADARQSTLAYLSPRLEGARAP